MSEFLEIMLAPCIACLILTGMHAYLGLHIVERGVLFVDLALAQMAALGWTIGFLMGYQLHSETSYFVSLAFTFVGALIFATTRAKQQRIPQEAIVGMTYAVAAAASILVLSRAPEGAEELKALMVGHLLFVNWSEVLHLFILYSIVGIFHWFIRKQVYEVTYNPELCFQRGMNVRLWDLLFYMSFGFVVTSSVELAGVLLVFSFLVIPAVCAILLASSTKMRLAVGWFVGAITSVIGMFGSYYLDLPTGATVVVTFGVVAILSAAIGQLKPAS